MQESFSVFVLHSDLGAELIGIPKKVDLRKLVAFLNSKGVEVQTRKSVPEHFTRPLHLAFPAAAVAAGVVVLGLGLTIYGWAEAGKVQLADNRDAVQMPQMPEPPAPQAPVVPRLPFNKPASDATSENPQPVPSAVPDRNGDTNPTNGDFAGVPQNVGPNKVPGPAGPFGNGPRPGFGNRPRPGGGPPSGFGPGPRFGNRPGPGTQRPGGAGPSSQTPGNPRPAGVQPVRNQDLDPKAELLGGPGGRPFRVVSPQQQPLLGFSHRMGSWAGKAAVSRLEPIFTQDPAPRGQDLILAKDGYAVGGLNVVSGDFVNALQVIFLRLGEDGRLDPADSYTSEWIGEVGEEEPKKLGGTGAKVIGIQGRRVAVVDAIGLVYE